MSHHQTETTQNLSKMVKEKGGGGYQGRGAGRRDRKVCKELGENPTPHVGTDVDTPGGRNWGNSFLVALIFFENLALRLSADSGRGELTGALEEVPREAVMGSEGKRRERRRPSRASGETGPAVHEAS